MGNTKQTRKEKEKELCFKKLLYACVYLYDTIEKEEAIVRTQEMTTAKGQVTTYRSP